MRSPYSRVLRYQGEAVDVPARIARLRRQLAITERYIAGWDAWKADPTKPKPVYYEAHGGEAGLRGYRKILLEELRDAGAETETND